MDSNIVRMVILPVIVVSHMSKYVPRVPYPDWDRTRNQVYYRLRGATVVQKDKTKIASDYKSITCVFQLWPLADLNC